MGGVRLRTGPVKFFLGANKLSGAPGMTKEIASTLNKERSDISLERYGGGV